MDTDTQDNNTVLLVTGLSGAGMSTTLKSLEDTGYEVMDNLPIALVQAAVNNRTDPPKPLAIGIDCRTRDFDTRAIQDLIDDLKVNQNIDTRLLLITAADSALQQRFSETRRRHPLALDRSVSDGITKERELLAPLYDTADDVIDTTELNVHDLRRITAGRYMTGQAHGLTVFVTSFGFKNGIPREADLVFDVRFLWNPHYDEKLRPLTGQHELIQKRLQTEPGYQNFFKHFTAMLKDLVPLYQEEGKSYLTIAIGCTGGRHRSVFVAEQIYNWLDEQGFSTGIKHRDLDRWLMQQKEKGDKIAAPDIQNERKTL